MSEEDAKKFAVIDPEHLDSMISAWREVTTPSVVLAIDDLHALIARLERAETKQDDALAATRQEVKRLNSQLDYAARALEDARSLEDFLSAGEEETWREWAVVLPATDRFPAGGHRIVGDDRVGCPDERAETARQAAKESGGQAVVRDVWAGPWWPVEERGA